MTTQELPVLTVSQLTNAIKLSLETTFPSIWLQGEISNCKLQTSGHLYFSLKDAKAQIGAVMFRGDMTSLKNPPKDGDNVIVNGDLNVYPPSGKYQIVVRELKQMGVGELLQKLEELKVKLHKKGWFRSEHKKPIPKFPKRIGVITSPTGAVIQDILNILTRRFKGFHLILNPVRVQGEGSGQEIAAAIKDFNLHNLVDVLIVGRGGGSIEDLWAFNEEIVAEAIFNSHIPIISAVGHETDHCIADYVADLRAPTPSAAAEIVSADRMHQLSILSNLQNRLMQTLQHITRQRRHQLSGILKQPIFVSPYTILGSWIQQNDSWKHNLDDSMQQFLAKKHLLLEAKQQHLRALRPTTQIQQFKQKLNQWDRAVRNAMGMRILNTKKMLTQKNDRLNQAWKAKYNSHQNLFDSTIKKRQLNQSWQSFLSLRKERLLQITAILSSANPKNLLSSGYCILFSEKDGSVITSVENIKKQEDVRILLSDGFAISTIKEVFSGHTTKTK